MITTYILKNDQVVEIKLAVYTGGKDTKCDSFTRSLADHYIASLQRAGMYLKREDAEEELLRRRKESFRRLLKETKQQ